jgi:hypothetical protein
MAHTASASGRDGQRVALSWQAAGPLSGADRKYFAQSELYGVDPNPT